MTWRDQIEPVDWPEDDERLIGRHMYLGQPHVYSAVVRAAMTHSGICRVLDHVVGACVPFWDGAYKCMQSMFVVKPPGGSGSPWHQDEHPIPTRDRSLTGVWIALTDATVAERLPVDPAGQPQVGGDLRALRPRPAGPSTAIQSRVASTRPEPSRSR